MDIRQLRYFIATAEELHFGRAAARLGVSQPLLSQQIRTLEQEFDVVLLERTSRRVELTPAGVALLDGARAVAGEIDRTRDAVRDVATGRGGRLTVGSVAAGFNGVLVPILRRLRVESPELDVTLRLQPSSARLLRQIRDGTLDVALLRGAPATAGVTVHGLYDEPFVTYMPIGHRLAKDGSTAMALSELADEPMVLWPRSMAPQFHDVIVGGCLKSGFHPNVVSEEQSLEAQLALVAAGFGVSLQPASNAQLTRLDLTTRLIEPETLRCGMDVAYAVNRRPAALDTFLAIARDVIADDTLLNPAGDQRARGTRPVRST
ncbi:LysR family transcriptional regulator [Ruania alba]|uniref:DNA-binding transcriptional regulator, LysR family n=1 Tax=Ruania alba TaxID=648782 RepID=A0A1H5M768_9MICO|nr:LysR substrate-binding domain-containing protein [Ruania alba]SEE85115.1 DNA-binding transcriptional regulator, LysR family [Ruania alba]